MHDKCTHAVPPFCLPRWRNGRGFTLLELLVVVLIMGLVAMLTVPTLSGSLRRSQLVAAASEVVNAFDFARLKAVQSAQQTQVAVSPSLDTISVKHYQPGADFYNAGDSLAASDVEHAVWVRYPHPLVKGRDYVIDVASGARFGGTDVVYSDIDSTDPVVFGPQGRPSHGGSVRLALGDQLLEVTLDGLTGQIVVSQ
jgi:prepilin-type N-terminal cleavage/methylation domain-containing protein